MQQPHNELDPEDRTDVLRVRPQGARCTNSNTITGTWQPYVKNYAPNPSFDYGGRAAALWLDR